MGVDKIPKQTHCWRKAGQEDHALADPSFPTCMVRRSASIAVLALRFHEIGYWVFAGAHLRAVKRRTGDLMNDIGLLRRV